MKKLIATALTLLLILTCTGCGLKAMTYEGNLGYDFTQTKSKEIVFRAYHSNTEDHTWELLKEFTYTPKDGTYADVRVDADMGSHLDIVLEENSVEKKEDTIYYDGEDLDSFGFDVEGFEGFLSSSQYYEIKNTSGEQFYRLYLINNGSGPFYAELDLEKPYDVEEENLDNLLITVTIK